MTDTITTILQVTFETLQGLPSSDWADNPAAYDKATDQLHTNLCTASRLLEFERNPPTFNYFVHREDRQLLVGHADYVTFPIFTIHT